MNQTSISSRKRYAETLPLALIARRLSSILLSVLLLTNLYLGLLVWRSKDHTQILVMHGDTLIPIEGGEFAARSEQLAILRDFLKVAYNVGKNPEDSQRRITELVSRELLKQKSYDLHDVFDRAAGEGLTQEARVLEIRLLSANEWLATLNLSVSRNQSKAVTAKLEARIKFQSKERSISNWRAWEVESYEENTVR